MNSAVLMLAEDAVFLSRAMSSAGFFTASAGATGLTGKAVYPIQRIMALHKL
jgi:hypothetical protein